MAELAAAEVYASPAHSGKAVAQGLRAVVGWLGFLLQILAQLLRGTPSLARILSFVGLRHPLLSSSPSSSSPAFRPFPADELPTDTPPPLQVGQPEAIEKLTGLELSHIRYLEPPTRRNEKKENKNGKKREERKGARRWSDEPAFRCVIM